MTNLQRHQDTAAGTIKFLEKRLNMMEIKEKLTKSVIQSILRLIKLLSNVSNDFKTYIYMYHFALVDQLENNEEVES